MPETMKTTERLYTPRLVYAAEEKLWGRTQGSNKTDDKNVIDIDFQSKVMNSEGKKKCIYQKV